MWCVLTHTQFLHLSSRYKDLVQLYVVSYIRDKLFSKLQHLASYVSCHYAMAYDMYGLSMLFHYHRNCSIRDAVKSQLQETKYWKRVAGIGRLMMYDSYVSLIFFGGGHLMIDTLLT
jgi:hypothetical protein